MSADVHQCAAEGERHRDPRDGTIVSYGESLDRLLDGVFHDRCPRLSIKVCWMVALPFTITCRSTRDVAGRRGLMDHWLHVLFASPIDRVVNVLLRSRATPIMRTLSRSTVDQSKMNYARLARRGGEPEGRKRSGRISGGRLKRTIPATMEAILLAAADGLRRIACEAHEHARLSPANDKYSSRTAETTTTLKPKRAAQAAAATGSASFIQLWSQRFRVNRLLTLYCKTEAGCARL